MRPMPLKFGLFHGPHHATSLDPTYSFERDLQLIEHLDRLGFDEAWIGEHHSGGFENLPAPEVFIAAAAERTKHIRLGTGVKSLPYHHPLIVAETMAQLDHMTRGRVMFGAGPGALPTDAQMFGIGPAQLRPRMDEALDCIVPLLRGEIVTKKTDWFELREARIHFGCYTQPTMEIAVTSIRSPAGVQAAARHGAGVLVLGGVDDDSLAHHVSNWRIYEETCAKYGHQPDRSKWRFTLFIHCAETREQALKDVQYGLNTWIDYANDILPMASPPPRGLADPGTYMNESKRAIIGSPADVIRELERVRERVGDFGAVLIFQNDWANWPASRRSLELIAEEVRPRLNGTNWLRQDSYDRNAPKFMAIRDAARQGVEDAQARFEASRKSK